MIYEALRVSSGLKHDGFRAVVYLQNGECDLFSRKFSTPPVLVTASARRGCASL